MTRRLTTALCLAFGLLLGARAQSDITLEGKWAFALDRDGTLGPDYATTDSMLLPGTTDTNRRGDPLARTDETARLSRKYSYKGRAWYRREFHLPESWQGRPVFLCLERTKTTEVYIDGGRIGGSNDLSTPQLFRLPDSLGAGRHTLAIMVDNGSGLPPQVFSGSHALSEDTQTNWNGIIGRICLTLREATQTAGKVHPAFRDFHIEGRHFHANGRHIYLRGKHDAGVWPLTGHAPMDVASWTTYLRTCMDYGFNHVRFHSWCPPEAAFVAADSLGVYLQPELPYWGDFNAADSTLMGFLHKEGIRILQTYGHHPSFVMFGLGNELWGSVERMAEFVADFRRIAPDKLYTFGSNYFLGYKGAKPGMDYFTTCRVGGEAWGDYDTHTRGSFSFADAHDGGIINHFRPGSSRTLSEGCLRSAVPVIGHETGQFQTFPDFDETKKYTGVLTPCNLETFRSRLERSGMADLAEAFHRASGQWSVELYKADNELMLRTPEMAGFHMLDLQDYPGQGSAYVGILDAFMQSKGLTTPQEWRQWCDEAVVLFATEKFCYTNDERICGNLLWADYRLADTLNAKRLTYCLLDADGKPVADTRATIDLEATRNGLTEVGTVDLPLGRFDAPTRLTLHLSVDDETGRTINTNRYALWVYPAKCDLEKMKRKVIVTDTIDAATARHLERGAKVLLMPRASELTVGGLFITDYWNYRMFKTISENNGREVSPGTLGILTDPAHPIFRLFPTEEHTNWQWFPVVKASHPFILDNTPATYRPIVQVIDNIERNHKLGLVFEFAVGRGKLLVCMSNLESAAAYPEGRQFYASLLSYMHSPQFAPATRLTTAELHRLFTTPVAEDTMGKLFNITTY